MLCQQKTAFCKATSYREPTSSSHIYG